MASISIARELIMISSRALLTSPAARREDPTAAVGTKLLRLFKERGIDFFESEKGVGSSANRETQEGPNAADTTTSQDGKSSESSHHMTPEELYKMRMTLLPQL